MIFHIRHLHEKEKPKYVKKLSKLLGSVKRLPWRRAATIGLIIGKPLYRLGEGLYEKHKHRQHMKRAFSIGIAAVVALVILLLAFSLLVRIGGISLGSLMQVSGTSVAATEDGITNVLLLGQGDEKGIDLTDSIMIASIDPVRTKSVTLLSIPRDLYFLHTDHMETEKGKLNLLWRDNRILHSEKGMEYDEASELSMRQLADEIGFALGIEIHHYVKIDFAAFEEAVDALGGIEVDVPETINDTEYPDENWGYQTFHIDAGRQHMDGATALKYARTRSTSSDFDRSARQQQIVNAAMEAGRASGLVKKPRKILDLFSVLREHIVTDLKTRQMITLASIAKDLNRDRLISLQLNNVNGLYEEPLYKAGLLYAPPRDLFVGDSVLLPVSIPEFPVTWKQIRLLTHLFFMKRGLYLDHPQFTILNGGAPEGSARRVSRELTKFGFDVVNVTNVPGKRDIAQSFVSHNTAEVDEDIALFFATILGITKRPLPEDMRETNTGDITIVLGEDFRFSFFQNLLTP